MLNGDDGQRLRPFDRDENELAWRDKEISQARTKERKGMSQGARWA
jgi:hypothetical protein